MESTLSLKKIDLEASVGLFFGWGRGPEFGDEEWDDRKQAMIEDCVKSGLRQFYFPAPLNGQPYDWSFLRPSSTITLASGANTIAMPDDFGGFEGEVTIVSMATSAWGPIKLVNEGVVNDLYANTPAATGRPLAICLRPLKDTGLTNGSRYQLYVFPTANQEYTLRFSYYILANCLNGTHPYAYGGMAHAETILESCLAIAEQRYDDTSAVHSSKYIERLAASIALDRRLKPQTGGRNTDDSDVRDYRRFSRDAVVTYRGVAY